MHITLVLISSTLMKFMNMPCWQYFSDTHTGLGIQVDVIYSRSQELTLVVFPVHTLTESHSILSDCIFTVTLCGFVSHMLLFIFGRVCLFLQQHTVSVAPICAKLALGHFSRNFTDDCPYGWDCRSLLLHYSHLYLSGAVLNCWILVSRLLGILLCITRCLYTQHWKS